MLRLETNHAGALADRYRDEPSILAWDLSDEPPFWIVRPPHTTDAVNQFTCRIAGAVRRVYLTTWRALAPTRKIYGGALSRPDNINN